MTEWTDSLFASIYGKSSRKFEYFGVHERERDRDDLSIIKILMCVHFMSFIETRKNSIMICFLTRYITLGSLEYKKVIGFRITPIFNSEDWNQSS